MFLGQPQRVADVVRPADVVQAALLLRRLPGLDATVNLAGQPSQLTANGVSLANSLLEVGDVGVLNLSFGSNSGYTQEFNDPNAMTIDAGGQVNVNGAAFTTAGLTIAADGALHVDGVFNGADAETASVGGPITNNGVIFVAGLEATSFQPQSLFTGAIGGERHFAHLLPKTALSQTTQDVTSDVLDVWFAA